MLKQKVYVKFSFLRQNGLFLARNIGVGEHMQVHVMVSKFSSLEAIALQRRPSIIHSNSGV